MSAFGAIRRLPMRIPGCSRSTPSWIMKKSPMSVVSTNVAPLTYLMEPEVGEEIEGD